MCLAKKERIRFKVSTLTDCPVANCLALPRPTEVNPCPALPSEIQSKAL